jgi:hypothetical protein
VAYLVKGSADGARTGAVRNIGSGAPRVRESAGWCAPGAVADIAVRTRVSLRHLKSQVKGLV